MRVIFLNSFKKDIQKITSSKLKEQVIALILLFESSESIQAINGIKKLKGHPYAYRKRMGDYRLGFYYENEVIEFARLVKRNDIYQLFP